MFQVLVVEDDVNQAEVLVDHLRQRGHQVQHVTHGYQAMAMEIVPDFILLDLNLPDMEGIQLCGQLKTKHPNAFVVMLTARKEEIDRILGLEIGADDYVTKPYSLREVEARMKAIKRRNQKQQGLAGVGLSMDDARCLVSYKGNYLSLTAQEFNLLALLVKAPERIFSRNQLIDLVWDEGIHVTDRVVDAMVARIRKKLRKSFGSDFIFTKHGLGYGYRPN